MNPCFVVRASDPIVKISRGYVILYNQPLVKGFDLQITNTEAESDDRFSLIPSANLLRTRI